MKINQRWALPLMEACNQMDKGQTKEARESFTNLKQEMTAAGEPESTIQIIDRYLQAIDVLEEILRCKENGESKEKIAALLKKMRDILRG